MIVHKGYEGEVGREESAAEMPQTKWRARGGWEEGRGGVSRNFHEYREFAVWAGEREA